MPIQTWQTATKSKLCSFQALGMFRLPVWLAQLVERQSAVREVEGSGPRPDQHSES